MQKIESKIKLTHHDLMQWRIHEILVVSSLYDAFKVEEDGQLGELIFFEYKHMHLTSPPRVTRVSTAKEALELLNKKYFSLVITMSRISDMTPFTFALKAKEIYEKLSVVLLASSKKEHQWLLKSNPDTSGIDRIFYWMGESAIFTAIIKWLEDIKNAERDIIDGGSRAIIVVEDSPHFYSTFLPTIYKVIIRSTLSLLEKEYTESSRQYRIRSRPKILLASTYEEAIEYIDRYQNNILTVISDVRFPKGGVVDKHAGVKLLKHVLKQNPSMPVMLQSMEAENEEVAYSINAYYLHKSSSRLIKDLKEFIQNHCGFGDLIFSTVEKEEIRRVTNLREFEEALSEVPAQSIAYHARRDHFSNWLSIRGYFELADILKPISIDAFEDMEELREIVISLVSNERNRRFKDTIVYFDSENYDPAYHFLRFGNGSLGGKARGLAFLANYMHENKLKHKFKDVTIDIPPFAVVTTEIYDNFLERNHILEKLEKTQTDDDVIKLFINGNFGDDFTNQLITYINYHRVPLAIRSSSLMEDSLFQPFAGIYTTYMIPNCAESFDERLDQLFKAIKMVFASVYLKNTIAYMKATGNRTEDEKMAVIIQHLIGLKYGENYYPSFSGVLQSYNYYQQGPMKREDGVATVALGLGKIVVEGGRSLKFSPKHPKVLPQFFSEKSILNNSQESFYALSMKNNCHSDLEHGEESNLSKLGLKVAEKDGALDLVGSVMDDHGVLKEMLMKKGPRVVSFNNILKWNAFPLADILNQLAKSGKIGMGCDVEIEFTANVDPLEGIRDFFILQIRPMITYDQGTNFNREDFTRDDLLFESTISLGNGIKENICDIILVKTDNFEPLKTREIVPEINKLNKMFSATQPFLLMGPGRWGSSDPSLGIPVIWSDISNVAVIVEIGLPDFYVEPSFGSHFFQNISSLGLSYITIPPHKQNDDINWKWLKTAKVKYESKYLVHIQLKESITLQVDGISGNGIAILPGVIENLIFRKEEKLR